MPILWTRDGTQRVLWEPTTDLICSACREPLEVKPPSLGTVNFSFDFVEPDPLTRGEYWYLHKKCARIEDRLQVNWGWHSLAWVLGGDKTMTYYFGNLRQYLRKRMPDGCYDQLYAAWLPAIKPQAARRLALQSPRQRQDAPPPQKPPTFPARPGVVYILLAEGTPRIKIGRSAVAPVRFETLQTASPYPLRHLRAIPSQDAVRLETMLHRRYAQYRKHREWFELPVEILEALLREDFP